MFDFRWKSYKPIGNNDTNKPKRQNNFANRFFKKNPPIRRDEKHTQLRLLLHI